MQKKSSKKPQRDIGSELGRIAFPLIILSAAIFTLLSLTVLFKIDTVVIKGGSDYTTEEILSACEINGGENLIRTSMGRSAKKIEDRLIYIEKAVLKRKFPSTLEINITPAVETVSAEHDGKYCILSEQGKILKVADEPVPDTIVIYGAQPQIVKEDWEIEAEQTTTADSAVTSEDADEQQDEDVIPVPVVGEKFACTDEYRTEVFYLLLSTASTALSEKTNHYDMTDYINISCLYDNRITIVFGSTAELDYKIRLAENIITTKISSDSVGTLKMLDKGASFIDKEGLEHNEQVYQQNINPVTEDTSNSTESTEETSSAVVNFE